MNPKPLLTFAAALCCAAAVHASTTPLDVALPYNYFVFGNFSASTDITGRIAVGGTLSSGITVGSDLPNGSDPYSLAADPISLYANNVQSGNSLNINKGSVYVAAGYSGSNYNLNGGGSKLATCAPNCIDFSSAATSLKNYSLQLSQLAANGTVGGAVDPNNPSFTALRGNNPTLNVFNLTAAQFQTLPLDLIITGGGTTIINVSGSVTKSGGALTFNGVQASGTQSAGSKVLFNFYSATSVAINNQFSASVFAPFANYSGTAQLDGNVIAASVSASGETHDALFTGQNNLPGAVVTTATPEPSTAFLFAGAGLIALGWRRLRKRS